MSDQMQETTKELDEKLRLLAKMRKTKKQYQAKLDALSEEYEKLNQELVEIFRDNKWTQLKLKKIGTFFIVQTSYPQIEDKSKVEAWLKEGGDYELMLSFNSKKFQGYYNERLDNGLPLPDGVKQFIKTEIRVRK